MTNRNILIVLGSVGIMILTYCSVRAGVHWYNRTWPPLIGRVMESKWPEGSRYVSSDYSVLWAERDETILLSGVVSGDPVDPEFTIGLLLGAHPDDLQSRPFIVISGDIRSKLRWLDDSREKAGEYWMAGVAGTVSDLKLLTEDDARIEIGGHEQSLSPQTIADFRELLNRSQKIGLP